MTKRLVVFATSLAVLIFIIGCSPVKSEPVELSKAELPKAKPPKAELPETKIPQIEQPKVEIPKLEQPKVEPPKIEPPKTESPKAEPPKTEPPKTEPPKAEPAKVKPHPTVSFHNKCAEILSRFVDDKGMVDYRALKRKKPDLKQLLNEFDHLDPNEYDRWPREDKIAFWLNAYNIQMLKIIIDNYPIESSPVYRLWWPPTSIRHIPPTGAIRAAKWDGYKFIVMDEQFTLSEIGQRFFCKEFDEPRIFFAVSHASLSSPPLRNEPYYGHKLYEQLDDQAKRFLSSPLAFKIDREKQRVYLSAILKSSWYGKEFISKYGTNKKFKDQNPSTRAVLSFITNYISKQDVSFLETGNYFVKYINYDWRLNDK